MSFVIRRLFIVWYVVLLFFILGIDGLDLLLHLMQMFRNHKDSLFQPIVSVIQPLTPNIPYGFNARTAASRPVSLPSAR